MTRILMLLICLASSAVGAAAQTKPPAPEPPAATPVMPRQAKPSPFPTPEEFRFALPLHVEDAPNVNLWLPPHEDRFGIFPPSLEYALAEADEQVKSIAVSPERTITFTTNTQAGPYSSGLQAMSRHQYDQAVALFDEVIAKKDARADAALYWKAFTQFKAAKSAEALGAIAQLRRDYPQSRYLSDTKILEADVRRLTGQPVNVEDQAANDDIKILAIQAMQRTDPERALPLLEGVLSSANALEVKRRAIYVLALSDDARARPVLLRYAKGAGSPDLQPDAIRYLMSRSDQTAVSADLKEIYESSSDVAVRRSIIDAYGAGTGMGRGTFVLTRGGSSFGGRGGTVVTESTVERLGPVPPGTVKIRSTVGAPDDLWTLYQKEPDASLRMQMASVLGSMAATERVLEIARTDKDVAVRQRAIRVLGNQGTDRTGQTLVDLYAANQDRGVRTAVIQALGSQTNADALVAIARKETNLELKKQIVGQLSNMTARSKVAADYLMEMLK